jgi:hypothetical protein
VHGKLRALPGCMASPRALQALRRFGLHQKPVRVRHHHSRKNGTPDSFARQMAAEDPLDSLARLAGVCASLYVYGKLKEPYVSDGNLCLCSLVPKQ